MFRIGLQKAPVILHYNKDPRIKDQERRYLINFEYVSSYILILLLPPVLISALYLKSGIIFFIWLAFYTSIKLNYLLSVRRRYFLTFLLLLIINDVVVLSGCLMGTFWYYYDKIVKKNHS